MTQISSKFSDPARQDSSSEGVPQPDGERVFNCSRTVAPLAQHECLARPPCGSPSCSAQSKSFPSMAPHTHTHRGTTSHLLAITWQVTEVGATSGTIGAPFPAEVSLTAGSRGQREVSSVCPTSATSRRTKSPAVNRPQQRRLRFPNDSDQWAATMEFPFKWG